MSRLLSRFVGLLLACCLVWSVLPGGGALADQRVLPTDESAVSDDLVRPDWVSASVTARASGRRVEVLSQRSEFGRAWVRPDGLVDEETAAGPVRFRDPGAADGWRAIDTSLVRGADGRLRARAVRAGVTLGSGSAPVVDVAGSLSLSLPGVVLPEPVVDGSTAVYVDVVAGVDVRVEVLPVGFELLWVVKSRAGAAELLRRWGGSGGLELPTSVSTPASVRSGVQDGRLVLTGPLGAPVGAFGAPVMWEAPASKAESRGVVVPVEFQLGSGRACCQLPSPCGRLETACIIEVIS